MSMDSEITVTVPEPGCTSASAEHRYRPIFTSLPINYWCQLPVFGILCWLIFWGGVGGQRHQRAHAHSHLLSEGKSCFLWVMKNLISLTKKGKTKILVPALTIGQIDMLNIGTDPAFHNRCILIPEFFMSWIHQMFKNVHESMSPCWLHCITSWQLHIQAANPLIYYIPEVLLDSHVETAEATEVHWPHIHVDKTIWLCQMNHDPEEVKL